MTKILAIDDKTDNLVTLSALLKHLMPECAVITAQSGLEGIEKALAELPDAILLDVKMPSMDGFETCRRLTADEDTKRIPVIMITAIQTDPESRIKGLECGANAFLSKPIDETELVSQVKVALRVKQAEDALRIERDSLEAMVQERTMALRKSEEMFRGIFERSPIGKSLTAPDGRLMRVNRAFADMLGYTVEEMQALTFSALTHPDDLAQSRECVRSLLSGEKEVYRLQKRYLHRSSEIVWTDVNTRLLRDEEGAPHYFITTIVDITERKRAEEKITEQLRELQRWHDVMLDREDRVIALKREVNELLARAGQPPRYRAAQTHEA